MGRAVPSNRPMSMLVGLDSASASTSEAPCARFATLRPLHARWVTVPLQCSVHSLHSLPLLCSLRVSSSLASLLCHCTMLYMLHQCRSTAQVASWVGWGASVAHVQCAGWVSGRLLVSRHWHIVWVDMNHSIIQSYVGGWVVGDGDDDRVSRRWSIV